MPDRPQEKQRKKKDKTVRKHLQIYPVQLFWFSYTLSQIQMFLLQCTYTHILCSVNTQPVFCSKKKFGTKCYNILIGMLHIPARLRLFSWNNWSLSRAPPCNVPACFYWNHVSRGSRYTNWVLVILSFHILSSNSVLVAMVRLPRRVQLFMLSVQVTMPPCGIPLALYVQSAARVW